jgi:hypothetical protein
MGHVVVCLGFACSSTECGVERVVLEKAHAVVGIVTIVKGRVDSCWKTGWGLEVLYSWQALVGLAVTVATSNHDLEVLTPLTRVGGCVGCDRISI